jgi:hypothetical protein
MRANVPLAPDDEWHASTPRQSKDSVLNGRFARSPTTNNPCHADAIRASRSACMEMSKQYALLISLRIDFIFFILHGPEPASSSELAGGYHPIHYTQPRSCEYIARNRAAGLHNGRFDNDHRPPAASRSHLKIREPFVLCLSYSSLPLLSWERDRVRVISM